MNMYKIGSPDELREWPSSFPPEPGEGNVEYKLKLVNPSKSRFEHLVTQMKWRLREGQGEAIYKIGVEDNGIIAGLSDSEMDASMETLKGMASRLGASISLLREWIIEEELDKVQKIASEVLVRKIPDDLQTIDLRVAVLGNMDAGKSTLLGVLTQGEMDNGRGRARLNLFRHLHEIQSGRTSSISHEILGFNLQGEIINQRKVPLAEEICENASKLITFIDLAGHHKYLKTTIFGLTGYCPHFAMLVVSASSGIAGTTKEHLGLAIALEVPIFVVVSKLDICSPANLKKVIYQLENLLKSPGCNRIPYHMKHLDDVVNAAATMPNGNVVPIFGLSNVTGEGFDLLTKFLNLLPPFSSIQERDKLMQEPAEFQIDEIYHISEIGYVVGGLLAKGVIKGGDPLVLGPTKEGRFVNVIVNSIHRNRAPCRMVKAGQSASIAIGSSVDISVRKGMTLLCRTIKPQLCLYFQARIFVLFHTTVIYEGFQAMAYIGNIRQAVTIQGIMAKKGIQTNDSATVMFKFMKHPEHLHVNTRFLFREGITKGIGHITQVFPIENNFTLQR